MNRGRGDGKELEDMLGRDLTDEELLAREGPFVGSGARRPEKVIIYYCVHPDCKHI